MYKTEKEWEDRYKLPKKKTKLELKDFIKQVRKRAKEIENIKH